MIVAVSNDFFIRVYPSLPGQSGNNSLIGESGLRKLLADDDLVDNIIDGAYAAGKDKWRKKLRRGYTIEFASK